MKKLHVLLTCGSTASMLCACATLIIDGPCIYIYVFASLGMVLSVLAWIAGKREIHNRGLVFAPITLPAIEEAWIEETNRQAHDIATYCNMPPLLVAHKIFEMPEEWDAFAEELRKP